MLRVGSWLYGGKKPIASLSTQSLDSLAESQELTNAMAAISHILNDDIEGAEERLKQSNSAFHKLGIGAVAFIRATLGFKQEALREAFDRLADAETSSSNEQNKAIHTSNAPNAYQSSIYAPGTEFALTQCLAQLMGAVVCVQLGGLTDTIKGFYKLRKAYITLDGIMQMERRYLQDRAVASTVASTRGSSESITRAGSGAENEDVKNSGAVKDENTAFPKPHHSTPTFQLPQDDEETPKKQAPPQQGEKLPVKGKALDPVQNLTGRLPKLSVSTGDLRSQRTSTPRQEQENTPEPNFNSDPDSGIFNHPIDAYIHSGANLCFGVLLLVISMFPPTFSKLLAVVGFRGDKELGLRMLWQASKFHNMNGAMAALAILGYYNAFVRFCDIVADGTGEEDDVGGYPAAQLSSLLSDARARYPTSQLWLLEESRMHSANRRLDTGLKLLLGEHKSPLLQIQMLHAFERSLNAMYMHQYELCASSFDECAELDPGTRALFYYIAASSHFALYRQNIQTSPDVAQKHGDKALELFRLAPEHAGKRKILARQLPFDTFVVRKVAKWEARAKEWKVDFLDAIGIDPLEEMIFFWNGYNRMPAEQLEQCLQNLSWSDSSSNPHWHRESLDEQAILSLLRACIYRSLGRHDEAKNMLQGEILQHDKLLFKGYLKDEWTLPTAHYEMAANLWMERHAYIPQVPLSDSPKPKADPVEDQASRDEHDALKVKECKEWLDKAAKWERYDLDSQIGLKVSSGEEAIRKWEALHSTT
ncbi:Mitochondrial outer membrane protein iml2 [Arachnomyces sp. PD_36]|nr:Mitochondrial outer membrane protein iml2 [Arachnomyces sp. PD_36]